MALPTLASRSRRRSPSAPQKLDPQLECTDHGLLLVSTTRRRAPRTTLIKLSEGLVYPSLAKLDKNIPQNPRWDEPARGRCVASAKKVTDLRSAAEATDTPTCSEAQIVEGAQGRSVMRSVGLDLGARHIAWCQVINGMVTRRGSVHRLEELEPLLGTATPPARVAFEASREAWHVHDVMVGWGKEPVLLDTTRIRRIGVGQHLPQERFDRCRSHRDGPGRREGTGGPRTITGAACSTRKAECAQRVGRDASPSGDAAAGIGACDGSPDLDFEHGYLSGEAAGGTDRRVDARPNGASGRDAHGRPEAAGGSGQADRPSGQGPGWRSSWLRPSYRSSTRQTGFAMPTPCRRTWV
jgi:hypothetical protein